MDKDDNIFLRHILESIAKIEEYTDEVTQDEFYSSTKLQDAVVKRIEIIGEAANNLTVAYKNKHSYIPWQDIIDMRNLLIHEYFGIDKAEVWQAVKEDISLLRKEIKTLLK